MSIQPPMAPLQPLPYHVTLCRHLKQNEPDVWKWFASAQAQSNYTESLQLELLKKTYRLDRVAHADLYSLGDTALECLGLSASLTAQKEIARQLIPILGCTDLKRASVGGTLRT